MSIPHTLLVRLYLAQPAPPPRFFDVFLMPIFSISGLGFVGGRTKGSIDILVKYPARVSLFRRRAFDGIDLINPEMEIFYSSAGTYLLGN